ALPLSRDTREKIGARRALFVERLVAAIAVIAHSRSAQHNFWLHVPGRDGVREQRCATDATLANVALPVGRPSLGDRRSGEMDDCIASGQHTRVERRGHWIPLDVTRLRMTH